MRTIGIFGGVTWHSTLEYYRLINEGVQARLGGLHSARMVLHSVDFAEHYELSERLGREGAYAEEVGPIVAGLAAAGADFLVLCANTMHRYADLIEADGGPPVLHVADAVAADARARGLTRLGLLGTRYTMGEDFWRGRLAAAGVEVLVPAADDFREIDRLIFEELAAGRFTEQARRRCLEMVERLAGEGARAVVLGCTELPILFGDEPAALPLIDTLRVHAEAAVDAALAD